MVELEGGVSGGEKTGGQEGENNRVSGSRRGGQMRARGGERRREEERRGERSKRREARTYVGVLGALALLHALRGGPLELAERRLEVRVGEVLRLFGS